jgi:hypothetical protein
MSGGEDEHSVEQFSAEAADPALHLPGARGSGPLIICISSLAKTASNVLVNLVSRSRIRRKRRDKPAWRRR